MARTLYLMNGKDEASLARELERWRGGIDKTGEQNAKVLKEMHDDMVEIKECQVAQGKELVSLKVKVGIGSALGGLIGAGIVALATRGFH